MKEILYKLAQQIVTNEISEDEGISKIESLSKSELNWQEIIDELPSKCENIKFGNSLLLLLQKYSETLDNNARLQTLEKIFQLLSDSKLYRGIASLATVIGNLYKETGSLEEAISYFGKSRKLLKILDEQPEKEESPEEIISEEISDEVIMDELDEEEEQELRSPISQMALKPINKNLAKEENDLGKWENILSLAKKEANLIKECDALINLGEYYYRQKNIDKSANTCHESLKIAKDIHYLEGITKSYLGLGKVAIEQRETEEAISLFELAIASLEELKYILPSVSYDKEYYEIFNNVIHVCLNNNNNKKALYYVECYKKLSFLSDVSHLRSIRSCNVDEAIKEEYSLLLQKNYSLYNNLKQNSYQTQDIALIKQNNLRLKEIHQIFTTKDSKWQQKFSFHFDFPIDDLQQKISEATMLLEFFVTNKGTYIFFVHRKFIDILLLPELTEQYLQKLYQPLFEAESFLHLWSKWCLEKSHGSQETFQVINSKLTTYNWKNSYEAHNFWKIQMGLTTKKIAEIMLPEIVSRIESESVSRLILVPDNILSLYPLHLMQIEGSDFQVYLQDRYEIVYSTTTIAFYSSLSQSLNTKNKLLIAHYTQQNVPFMREEIRIMNHIWPGEVIFQLGSNTNKNQFKNNFDDVSHIHLAVHSKNVNSRSSTIFFADGRFLTQDILNMKTGNIETISLGANEREIDLNNFKSFNAMYWALNQVGVKNIVSPMWSVPDIVTFFVTEKFYHGLGQGLSPTMALQEAQNELRSMTIEDIITRLEQQQKLSNEGKIPWIENICQFLLSEPISFDEKKMAISVIQSDRNIIHFEGKPIKVNLRDFILEMNGTIPGEAELLDKSFRPFAHPFYWGSFFCSGIGLTEIYFGENEESVNEHSEMMEAEEVNEVVIDDIQEENTFEEQELQPIAVKSQSKSPFDDIKIRATCPHCGTSIHCFLPMANKAAKCPKCKLKVKIPKREILLTEIAAGDPHTSVLLING